MEDMRSRVSLLDTWIDQVDTATAGERIGDFARRGIPAQVATVNLDFLRLSLKDESFRQILNSSGLVVADGMPLVWASRLLGSPLPERVAGVDLVDDSCRIAAEQGYRVFFLGAAPGVADKAAAVLQQRYPDLKIAGTYSPPSRSDEDDEQTLAIVEAAEPDILFVAFGAPHQERWIRKHMTTLRIPVCMGVGGSLDMFAGRVSRAPDWMQRSGTEWFYRFLLEPTRLGKRYFVHDLPLFFRLMARCSLAAPAEQVVVPLHLKVERLPSVPPQTAARLAPVPAASRRSS